ncbi:MAG: glycosyltransferase family 2 protein [Kiritimatiellia bacterium]
MNTSIAILIPSYEPDDQLRKLVPRLREAFAHVVVVDDGSTVGQDVFAELRPLVDRVLVHGRNRGKGVALRTGIAWIRDHLPDVEGLVTVDADGQHLPEDVVRVAEALARGSGILVLGVRTLPSSAPLRSRFGNWWARGVFRLMFGLSVQDTQTGLRGIPRSLFERMLSIPGDRYEYETEMLAEARHFPAPLVQIPIQTVYINSNRSSHYRPLRDTIRTQIVMLRCFFRRARGALASPKCRNLW